MPIDFANAPPPTPVAGAIAVPVHIRDLHAVVTMDAARSSGDVEATMTYVVGPAGGLPIFDLRQTVQSCRLDGVAIDPARIAGRDVGGGPWGTVRHRRRSGAPLDAPVKRVLSPGDPGCRAGRK